MRDSYNCHSFANEMEAGGLKRGARSVEFGGTTRQGSNHSGLDIGGNLYGQRFILSKQGSNFPITVNTARQLSTGAWFNRYHGVDAAGYPMNDVSSTRYGKVYY